MSTENTAPEVETYPGHAASNGEPGQPSIGSTGNLGEGILEQSEARAEGVTKEETAKLDDYRDYEERQQRLETLRTVNGDVDAAKIAYAWVKTGD